MWFCVIVRLKIQSNTWWEPLSFNDQRFKGGFKRKDQSIGLRDLQNRIFVVDRHLYNRSE